MKNQQSLQSSCAGREHQADGSCLSARLLKQVEVSQPRFGTVLEHLASV